MRSSHTCFVYSKKEMIIYMSLFLNWPWSHQSLPRKFKRLEFSNSNRRATTDQTRGHFAGLTHCFSVNKERMRRTLWGRDQWLPSCECTAVRSSSSFSCLSDAITDSARLPVAALGTPPAWPLFLCGKRRRYVSLWTHTWGSLVLCGMNVINYYLAT